MSVEKCKDAEPIRGYRLIERIGAGGFGEVWKCEAPGGIFKAVKFVYGSLNGLANDSVHAEEELRAVQLIKSIRHPFLLSIDRVEVVAGELVIVTELADENLHELWQHHVSRGVPGVPRDELLGYLQEVAEVLDLLNQKFDLQHLDVKPHNLFLVSNHVKVADFGLVNSLSDAVTAKLQAAMNAVTPLYAAPELFLGKLSRHCDQYSLAIVFQELLTGALPFQGKNLRQLLLQHTQAEPDLQSLSAHDRVIVARALAKSPDNRFGSCQEFIRALRADAPRPTVSEADIKLRGPAETVARFGDSTELPTLRNLPALPPRVFTDYKFQECLSNSPLMEVWKVKAADGTKKLVKILYGLGDPQETKLKDSLARVQSINHPAVLAPRVLFAEPGRIFMATDYVRNDLRARAQQCQAHKSAGIPRLELLDYIRAAAEVLDYLYQQHNVQHLNLNPRTLILDNGWVRLADFGSPQLLWFPAGQDIALRNQRYAAPEIFGSVWSRHCDQYSLAIIYAEMLTGVHPFRGWGPPAYRDKGMAPEVDQLPPLDATVIRRALDADPAKRWANCTEMALALEGTSPDLDNGLGDPSDLFTRLVERERTTKKRAVYTGVDPQSCNEIIAEMIAAAGGHVDASSTAIPVLTNADNVVEFRFIAGLPLGAAQERLHVFSSENACRIVRQDESSCTLHVDLPRGFWRRWWGGQPKLELRIEMSRVHLLSATPIEIRTKISALGCSKKEADRIQEQLGVDLFGRLQQQFLVCANKRAHDRILWPHPIKIIPLGPDGRQEEAVECRGKDLSQTGVGFYLPHNLGTCEVLIELPNLHGDGSVKVPATLVRVKRCADGWYEVGALFRMPTQNKSKAEICI